MYSSISWSLPVAAELALAAGIDQVMLKTERHVKDLLDHLEEAVRVGRLEAGRVRESFLRVVENEAPARLAYSRIEDE